MFCNSCGEKISDNGKFCGRCDAVAVSEPRVSSENVAGSDQSTQGISDERELQIALLLSEAKNSAKKIIWQGIGWIVAGIVITTITYTMADPGGTYFIFWSLSVYGAYLVIKGGYYRMAPHKLLEKAFSDIAEGGSKKEE